MRKIINTILSIGLIGTLPINANSLIEAKKVENLEEIKPASSSWLFVKPTRITLYPQINNIDQNSSKIEPINIAKKVTLQVLYDNKNIAFLIIWGDNTKNVQQKDQNISHSDGFSVQFAQTTEVKKLPYIKMGNKGRKVIIHVKEAEEKIDKNQYQKIFISEGSEDINNLKDINTTSKTDMEYANNGWKGTLIRPFKDNYIDLNHSSIPVSFTIWDGEKNSTKLISNWIGVKLEAKENNLLLKRLSRKVKGNIKKGKKIYDTNCVICHKTDNELKAPCLSNIGGYSTIDYLIESITQPSAIIIPNKDIKTEHKWYKLDDNGTKTSIMPSFEYMDKPSLIDLITYLKTFKAKSKK